MIIYYYIAIKMITALLYVIIAILYYVMNGLHVDVSRVAVSLRIRVYMIRMIYLLFIKLVG